MADVMESYVFGHGKRRNKYPWKLWFNGQIWRLTKGVDFDVPVHVMRCGAYQKAKRDGIVLNIEVDGECVILRAVVKANDEGGAEV